MRRVRPLRKNETAKVRSLRQSGTFNARAGKVHDRLFVEESFFDAQDLAQVKYEMLRRVQKEAMPVSHVSGDFGFSRPAFYKAQQDFAREGLAGLIPKKRGPKGGHKITAEVLAFINQIRTQAPMPMTEVVRQVQKKFAIQVHRRSLERALTGAKKKPSAP
jgi:transposase